MGRPRLVRHVARELAHMPPSEGQDTTVPMRRIEAAPARRRPPGDGRFGKELHLGEVDVGQGQDGLRLVAATEDRARRRPAQGFRTKIEHGSGDTAQNRVSFVVD